LLEGGVEPDLEPRLQDVLQVLGFPGQLDPIQPLDAAVVAFEPGDLAVAAIDPVGQAAMRRMPEGMQRIIGNSARRPEQHRRASSYKEIGKCVGVFKLRAGVINVKLGCLNCGGPIIISIDL
jgi:hypothetical protein